MKSIYAGLALGAFFVGAAAIAGVGEIGSASVSLDSSSVLSGDLSSVIVSNTEMAQAFKAAPGAIQISSTEQGRRVRFPSTGFRFFLADAGLYAPAQTCVVATHDTAHIVSLENCRFAQIANEMKSLLGSCPAKKIALMPPIVTPTGSVDDHQITYIEKLNLTLDENCKASRDYYQYKKVAVMNPLAILGAAFDGGNQGYFDLRNESKTISLEEVKSLLDTSEQKAAAVAAYKKYPENKLK